jgi:ATP-dependent helicase HrpB
MLVAAGEHGWGRTAAEVAVLLSEQGLGGNDPDLETRLRRWRTESGRRAEAGRGLAQRWAKLAGGGSGEGPVGACIALAFPDRVSKRRGADGADWIAVGGRGFRLDPASSLAREEWVAVAETQGSAAGARILSGATITENELKDLFRERIEIRRTVTFDPTTGAVQAMREQRLGAIRLASGPDGEADPTEVAAALVEGVRKHGLGLLPWSDGASALRQRAAYAGEEGLSDEALIARLDEWLPALVEGKRRLSDISGGALFQALENLIGWEGKRALDVAAPPHFTSLLGTSHAIDYGAEGGPAVELRVQALFGLAEHPMIGRTPLVLRLTSPAGRPIQTTRDLPGFWKGSWAAVAKEMRGRYPRHPWPDDPTQADPTLRTKKATARQNP